ncbi:MAG: nitroreductase family protein [Oscillospiraceae bacterium]
MNTLEAIAARVSYRGRFSDETVPRADLIKIMQAGLCAPSGCNKQTTSLIAVDDADLMSRLRAVIDPPICETAPCAICVLTQRTPAYRDKCFSTQDYSAAVENMLLAITELGYHSCWIEGHITDDDNIAGKLADILGVPQDYELVCYLPIGKAEQKITRVSKKPFEQCAWFNGFGKEN